MENNGLPLNITEDPRESMTIYTTDNEAYIVNRDEFLRVKTKQLKDRYSDLLGCNVPVLFLPLGKISPESERLAKIEENKLEIQRLEEENERLREEGTISF